MAAVVLALLVSVSLGSWAPGARGADLHWLLGVYNPLGWGDGPPVSVGGECGDNLYQYWRALTNGSEWAAKMTDASGRYGSQFFFGNDFWLGSHSLCAELQAPWPVVFHVARLRVQLSKSLTPQPRKVFLGLCSPASCTAADLTTLILGSSPASEEHHVTIERVRPVPGPYALLKDTKFHIIAGIALALSILMLVGTAFEVILQRRNDSRSDSKDAGSPGVFSRLLLAFSAVSNGRKMLQCESAEDALGAVHGLRFLSLAWVILVHTYLQVFAIAENKTLRSVTERNFMFQTISNATFSVDTFFFISGLLVTYLFFRTGSKREERQSLRKGALQFLSLTVYRFVRLTPPYLFVLGMVELTMRWLHNNSVFEPNIADHLNCDRFWWRNALYINSLFPRKDMCMLWSWYMANDTQFYILGVLLLLLVAKYPKLVASALSLLLLSSWITTAVVAINNQYKARIQEPFALFDELYDKPWTRVGPYLVGMATGWLLFKTKCKIKIPLVGVLLGWLLSMLCLLSLVYGLLHTQLNVLLSAAYVSLGHTAWSLALAWIVIACCSGYGGFVNTLLSFRALYPLSRLTYCAYLVHPMIMFHTSFQMDGPLHLHNGLVVILYLGNVVAAFLLSFLISIMLEAPIIKILKIVMVPEKKK